MPIDLDYGTVWTHVGYIASELCKYLHPLIAAGDVVDVTDVFVQCIKYRVENRILSKDFHKDTWGQLFKGGLALTLG